MQSGKRLKSNQRFGPAFDRGTFSPSTKMLLPVPITRLMVRLAVLATKTYLPTRVIQHEAAWPASTAAVNAPSRNNPSWFECASVMSAVPSGKVAKPNGASDP